jgi:hypothetical protein
MQSNGFTGSAQQGSRLPHAKQAFSARRKAPEASAKKPDADTSRQLAAQKPGRKWRRFGAGF